ncbi:MAG: Unknown protein [uncultured Thiotrichaceae bacterium]|uniref:Uncharacterized protein n=1 Tax=uncultured Thiotrichaceae bacterium TaxID=298394 RepID=A0A6S6U4B5_9GAMM|nr:MAG: Unknown protein [uncultured Thiotrichaceae bacterium]
MGFLRIKKNLSQLIGAFYLFTIDLVSFSAIKKRLLIDRPRFNQLSLTPLMFLITAF